MRNTRSVVAAIATLPVVGHCSVAAVYVTLGLLAGLAALGLRHRNPDLRAALEAIKDQPLGPVFLALLIVCSLALAIWRGLQSIADLERKGRSLAGLAQRARLIGSAALQIGLCVLSGAILAGYPTVSGEQVARASASELVVWPLGWFVLFASGAVCAIVGGFYFYRAFTGQFHAWFRCQEMSPAWMSVCFALGRLGYAARGAILLLVGYFLVVAGYYVRPEQVTGFAGALDALFQQPLGRGVVTLIAGGLVAHGLFALASARFGAVPEERIEEVVSAAQERCAALGLDERHSTVSAAD
jgi:hypothetical protein